MAPEDIDVASFSVRVKQLIKRFENFKEEDEKPNKKTLRRHTSFRRVKEESKDPTDVENIENWFWELKRNVFNYKVYDKNVHMELQTEMFNLLTNIIDFEGGNSVKMGTRRKELIKEIKNLIADLNSVLPQSNSGTSQPGKKKELILLKDESIDYSVSEVRKQWEVKAKAQDSASKLLPKNYSVWSKPKPIQSDTFNEIESITDENSNLAEMKQLNKSESNLDENDSAERPVKVENLRKLYESKSISSGLNIIQYSPNDEIKKLVRQKSIDYSINDLSQDKNEDVESREENSSEEESSTEEEEEESDENETSSSNEDQDSVDEVQEETVVEELQDLDPSKQTEEEDLTDQKLNQNENMNNSLSNGNYMMYRNLLTAKEEKADKDLKEDEDGNFENQNNEENSSDEYEEVDVEICNDQEELNPAEEKFEDSKDKINIEDYEYSLKENLSKTDWPSF